MEEIRGAVDAGDLEYLGFVENVQSAIEAASVIVLPSWHEGTPHSVLEGMAMGRPIIATDVRGCRQTVRHLETGLLVPVRDPNALAAAMVSLAADAGSRTSMGAASRALAEEQFDATAVAAATMEAIGLAGDLTGDVNP